MHTVTRGAGGVGAGGSGGVVVVGEGQGSPPGLLLLITQGEDSADQTNNHHDGGHSGASLGLALLIAMVSVALAIAIIALLISKMRRRQNTDSTDLEVDMPTDPYMQAIMFPSEPRPEWHRHLRQVIHKAGQKVFKKPDPHDTTIPENLRHQLKHIYVY